MAEEQTTYVAQSGLAVVHQGEKIVAAPGSEAVVTTHPGGEVHYHFPVHVVVVGELGEDVKSEIENRILSGLYSALA